MKQIANVAALPGIVGYSIGLPDVHSGYGFAIGEKIMLMVNYCEMILQAKMLILVKIDNVTLVHMIKLE